MAWDGKDRRSGDSGSERVARIEEWRENHEKLCGERYDALFKGVINLHGRINALIATVGGFTIAVLIGALGYFLSQKL